MRPFADLTDTGRVRRLRPLALDALQRWDVEPTTVRFLAEHTDVLFRVDTATGDRFVLRIGAPGEHTREENELAALWTAAIAEDGEVQVPAPVRSRDGGHVVEVVAPGVPEARLCTLVRWVPGRPAADDPAHYRLIGRAMAQLHRQALTFTPPADLSPAVWGRAFYWPGERVAVYDDDGPLGRAEREAVRRVQERVDALLADLHAASDAGARPRLIHSDLHADNVHLHRGRIWVIDFADLCLGTPAQDVGSALYYVRFGDEPEALSAALRSGYETVAPWPVGGEVDLLVAARALMLLNYCCNQRDDPDLAAFAPVLAGRILHLGG